MSVKTSLLKRYCGTCQFYSWSTLEGKKTSCNKLGSIDTTPACGCYSINPFMLQDFEQVLLPLSRALRALPLTALSLFYDVIAGERALRRRGYYLWKK